MHAERTPGTRTTPTLRVALINMPWSRADLPSIALTQLKSVVQEHMGDRVEVNVHYLNHDFADFLDYDVYDQVANATSATVSGLGDWLFRQAAFPDQPDNTAAYTRRYLRHLGLEKKTTDRLLAAREDIDAFLESLINRHRLEECAIAGLTSVFIQSLPSIAIARKLKARRPGIVTAMGGANCETSMGRVIARNVPSIDFVFSGPALEAFPHFVEYLASGNKDACHQIHGVYSKEKLQSDNADTCKVEICEDREIDRVVPLDYTDFLRSLERHWPLDKVKPSLLFETSRGCWWGERSHCTFCGLNGLSMNYRSMRPDVALRQFETLFRHAPAITSYKSVDNILPKQYFEEVLPRLEPPPNTSIFYEVKADLSEDNIKTLAAAGVTEIQPGIEALATSTLKLMGKGTTSFQNVRFLKSCLRYGVNPIWNLLIGFPGEPEDVYEKYVAVLPSLVHLPPPGGVYPVRFDRFSPYFNRAEEYGLQLKPYDSYRMIYPFSEEDLEQLAYFFEDRNYGAEYIRLTAKWLMPLREKISAWREKWHNRTNSGRARLEFAEPNRGTTVIDSRDGPEKQLHVGETGARILHTLETPFRLPRLADRLPDLTGDQIEQELARLLEMKLLFEDNGFYISLPASPASRPVTT